MKITDKQRLDWLSRYKPDLRADQSILAKRMCQVWIVEAGFETKWMPTLRQAIDAAIRAESRQKKAKPAPRQEKP
jgi:hypothetical protein